MLVVADVLMMWNGCGYSDKIKNILKNLVYNKKSSTFAK